MPCHPARAREFLRRGRAVVARRFPFTIRLRDRDGGAVQPVRLKIDPGAKVTGLALVREDGGRQHVLHLAEIAHRGGTVRANLHRRAAFRRRRRGANLRHRAPRFDNRARPKGWLPPSLRSRLGNVMAWVGRYQRLMPVAALSLERVRFDMQALEDPEISGVEYQQGTLAGYELREYLLEKWGRRCAYCDMAGVPLQVEHVRPRSRGGSDRVSSLALACGPCNQAKGAQAAEDFLAHDPERLRKILAQARRPLNAAAAVNATRNAIFLGLRASGLPVEAASGGGTKHNRARLGVPKAHCLDAACVGALSSLHGWAIPVFMIRAMGRGSHQRTRLDRFGFPRGFLMRSKAVHGFRTGDMVRAAVPSGKKRGVHLGRVAVRASGFFNVRTATGVVQGISHRHCVLLSRDDGYAYGTADHRALTGAGALLPALATGCARAGKDGVSALRRIG